MKKTLLAFLSGVSWLTLPLVAQGNLQEALDKADVLANTNPSQAIDYLIDRVDSYTHQLEEIEAAGFEEDEEASIHYGTLLSEKDQLSKKLTELIETHHDIFETEAFQQGHDHGQVEGLLSQETGAVSHETLLATDAFEGEGPSSAAVSRQSAQEGPEDLTSHALINLAQRIQSIKERYEVATDILSRNKLGKEIADLKAYGERILHHLRAHSLPIDEDSAIALAEAATLAEQVPPHWSELLPIDTVAGFMTTGERFEKGEYPQLVARGISASVIGTHEIKEAPEMFVPMLVDVIDQGLNRSHTGVFATVINLPGHYVTGAFDKKAGKLVLIDSLRLPSHEDRDILERLIAGLSEKTGVSWGLEVRATGVQHDETTCSLWAPLYVRQIGYSGDVEAYKKVNGFVQAVVDETRDLPPEEMRRKLMEVFAQGMGLEARISSFSSSNEFSPNWSLHEYLPIIEALRHSLNLPSVFLSKLEAQGEERGSGRQDDQAGISSRAQTSALQQADDYIAEALNDARNQPGWLSRMRGFVALDEVNFYRNTLARSEQLPLEVRAVIVEKLANFANQPERSLNGNIFNAKGRQVVQDLLEEARREIRRLAVSSEGN